MNFKKILASVSACALAVSAMSVAAFAEDGSEAKTFEGSLTVTSTGNWWDQVAVEDVTDLIGDLAPEEVTSITFTCVDATFGAGFNSVNVIDETAENPKWHQATSDAGTELTFTDIDLGENYGLNLIISSGTAGDYEITWVATTAPVEDDPADSSDDPADSSDEPADSSDDPADSSDEPADSSDEPADSSDEPADSSDEPADSSDEPTDSSDENGDPNSTNPAGNDKNEPTGVALAVIPAAVAAAGVIISKKRG